MKIVIASVALMVAAIPVSAFGLLTTFGMRAFNNMRKTPPCALKCVLNPRWAQTYAPECAKVPLGQEYGRLLCLNSIYQQELDNCFKDKCKRKPGTRKKVIFN